MGESGNIAFYQMESEVLKWEHTIWVKIHFLDGKIWYSTYLTHQNYYGSFITQYSNKKCAICVIQEHCIKPMDPAFLSTWSRRRIYYAWDFLKLLYTPFFLRPQFLFFLFLEESSIDEFPSIPAAIFFLHSYREELKFRSWLFKNYF